MTIIDFLYDTKGAIPMPSIESPCVPGVGDIVLISNVPHLVKRREFQFDHGMLERVILNLEEE